MTMAIKDHGDIVRVLFWLLAMAIAIIWFLSCAGCTTVNYDPATGKVAYTNGIFGKEFAVMDIKVAPDGTKEIHIEGYKSDATYAAEAVAKAVAGALTP